MLKVIKSLAVIAGVGVLAFGATRAVWSDSGTSTGNTFQAGTLDLKLSDSDDIQLDNVSLTWNGTAMTPGGSAVSADLLVRNVGDPAADHVHFEVTSNTITEGSGVGSDPASPMDRNLRLTALSYDGVSILSSAYLSDVNGNGWFDLDDLESMAAPGFGDHDGSVVPGDATLPLADLSADHTLSMSAQLDSSSPDANQGDTVTTVITVFLHQADGQ